MPLAVELPPAPKRSRAPLYLLPAAVLILALVLWPRQQPMEPDGGTAVPFVAAQTVPLVVNAYPWAEVILDGKSQGFTPRARPFEIAPGRHTLVLKNPHFGEKTVMLDLKAGREETVSVDLAEGKK